MHVSKTTLLTASAAFMLLQHSQVAAQDPSQAIKVRLEVLKRSTFERTANGPVLIGPQSTLEFEWRVLNQTGNPVEIPSLDAVLRLHVSAGGREIPVRTEWASTMTLQSGPADHRFVSDPQPVGAMTLADGTGFWVRGSSKTLDGSLFIPGDYVIQPDIHLSASETRNTARIDNGFPGEIHVVDVKSPERRRQFHMIEGTFYKEVDHARALEHFAALAALPGAPWMDSLPLAEMYGGLGRHREAIAVWRKILPELIGGLDKPMGDLFRRHLRSAAWSFAVEGDNAMAANLLRLEGNTPAGRIPAEIDRLRKLTPRAVENPK